MNYAKAIRMVRSARGLSQKDLAERLEVNPSYVSMLEAGSRLPGREVLESLARVLNVPVYLLMLLASEQEDHRGLPQDKADLLGKQLLDVLLNAQETFE